MAKAYSHPNVRCDRTAVAGAVLMILSAVSVVVAAIYLGLVR